MNRYAIRGTIRALFTYTPYSCTFQDLSTSLFHSANLIVAIVTLQLTDKRSPNNNYQK